MKPSEEMTIATSTSGMKAKLKREKNLAWTITQSRISMSIGMSVRTFI